MSTTIRTAVISTLALLALLMIAPSARADTYDITGHTNQATCNFFGGYNCPEMRFHMIATTVPWYGYLQVTSLKGEINGQWFSMNHDDGYMAEGLQGSSYLAVFSGPIPFVPPDFNYPTPLGEPWFYYLYDGQRGQFGLDDMITGSIYASGFGPVTWDADLVSTPEPSTLLLLLTGVGLLGGVIFLRKA
jgi:hypothetical protein